MKCKNSVSALLLLLFAAPAVAPPKETTSTEPAEQESNESSDADESSPQVSKVTTRGLLDAVDKCKQKVHSDHDTDLLCQDTSKAEKDVKDFCDQLGQLKDAGRPFDPLPAAKMFKDKKQVLQMSGTIKHGFKENYKCKWAGRTWEAFRRAVSRSKGEYDAMWMTDCMRPKMRELLADKPELAEMYGSETFASDEALRDMIRALNCPTDRINLDTREPFKELQKLPITLRQQINQFLPKVRDYLRCFWNVLKEKGSTFRMVFACDDDQRLYQKATKCAAGIPMAEGFKIDFPDTLRDYHLKRNKLAGSAPERENKGILRKAKDKVVGWASTLAGWGHRQVCKMASQFDSMGKKVEDQQAENAALRATAKDKQAATFPDGELPQAKRRRKRLSGNEIGCVAMFLFFACTVAGAVTGSVTHFWFTGPEASTTGGAFGAFIGLVVGFAAFMTTICVLKADKEVIKAASRD